MNAIVYESNTGHTKKYADMLAKKLNVPAYDIKRASGALKKGDEIIFLGWIKGGMIQGYKKVKSKYRLIAVCAVGMGIDGEEAADNIAKKNDITDTKVFYLQGGFDFNQLKGANHFIMNMMRQTMIPTYEEKKERTAEEENMFHCLKNGANFVSIDNLSNVLEWYRGLESEHE
jgi:hypothetical protein